MPIIPNPTKKKRSASISQFGSYNAGSTSVASRGTTLKAASAPSVPYTAPTSQASSVTLGAQAPAPATPDIRDPQYWLDAANIQNYYGTTKAQYGEQARQDAEALKRAQTILGVDTGGNILSGLDTAGNVAGGKGAEDIRKASEGANKAGLFYSGILGRDLGNIRTSYAQQNQGLVSENTGRTNLRNIALGGLETEYGAGGIKERQSAVDALARQQERDKGVAGAEPAAAAGPVGYSGFAGRGLVGDKYIDASGGVHATQKKGGKTYYLAGSGKWVAI